MGKFDGHVSLPLHTVVVGLKPAMALGLLGYAALTVAGMVYFSTGQSQGGLLFGGACVGVGAALLWTAQGTFLLQHADDSNRGEDQHSRVISISTSV